MNKEYKIKLDLNKKIYNKKMAFNQFDENVNDFYIEITKNNEVVKDLDKSIITLVAIKPNGEVDAQFIEVKEGQIYADLKPSMCDLVGNYQAKAMIVLEGEIVTTDTINYSVNEDKIISRLNDDVVSDERFTLFTDALARLSDIEASEEQRIVNEAERILAEENRKIEEVKRVEAELIRQHEEADRTKYDAIRESNENIRKQNESIRLANETNRIDEEAKRVEEENKRKLAEEERNANYNFMTEDEERRRSEANAHKEAEALRVQAETNRVNEEAKRRTTEQARVSAENTRVSNENTRETNELARKSNETQRVEAETQRQNRYNSFIADAEANANEFENYTNTAKVKEEERKANELDRKSQEDRRVSNENERVSSENTRKANELDREENEASRQDVFENKVNEVDEKISEINTTKDNFISSINTKVDNKISELDNAKTDMSNTVTNKIDEVENRFNALTSKQQQDAEVIDARDGETSLKVRLDRDIEKAKQVYASVEGSHISTDSSVGYLKDVEILGNTIQDASNLADIRSVGDKVEGQELYEIPVLSVGKNLWGFFNTSLDCYTKALIQPEYYGKFIKVKPNTTYTIKCKPITLTSGHYIVLNICNSSKSKFEVLNQCRTGDNNNNINNVVTITTLEDGLLGISVYIYDFRNISHWQEFINLPIQIEEGTVATPYEPYQKDKLTILSPVQLEKVGDVADRIICKDGVWGVEKNILNIKFKPNAFYSGTNVNLVRMNVHTLFKFISWESGQFISELEELTNATNWDVLSNVGKFSTITGTNKFDIICSKDIDSIEKFNEDISIIGVALVPTFIPLPHSQQVKLRTFANKTNILFGCEIEGTIKAQVPKSLGATVNTHTEQISNLNKELDRVKKLEESTVSTVTTESDFTTVEATSNGYFEDVKLEGKTLVNLMDGTKTYFNGRDIIVVNYNTSMLKPNTEYTVCLIDQNPNLKSDTFFSSVNMTVSTSVDITKPIKLVTKDTINTDIRGFYYYLKPEFVGDSSKVPSDLKVVLLEGDHTQNPPSYFEGLKSVGQSATTSEDGADEIVVESVDDNINNRDNSFTEIAIADGGENRDKSVITTGFNHISADDDAVYLYRNGERSTNIVSRRYYSKNKVYLGATYTDDACYVRFRFLNASGNYEGDISEYKVLNSTMKEGKSDKKRLLYYNNETQSWEKPVLRQWDSIEKHADGKYYYHQRSGEVVLNGSENWGKHDTIESYTSFYLKPSKPFKALTNLFCTHFNFYTGAWNPANGKEGITLDTNGKIYIQISNSKLSTQDVTGFKQWLQTNPVTVVYQLAEEKVYECTNIDLITYNGETNYIVESGAIVPRTTLKVHNNISNVVSLLQKKVSLLESNITSYMITQNRLMLASRYNADTVSFKVDVASYNNSFEYDNDLYELILNNILVGKDNYNRDYIENLIIFYWMDFVISDEMYLTLFEIIEEQHNPKVIEEAPIE